VPTVLEELEGGPVITITRNDATARRYCKVPWEADLTSINAGLTELFPNTYPPATLPGWGWLQVQKVEVAPYDPSNPRPGPDGQLNSYAAGAKFSIDYATNRDDQGVQSAPGGTPIKSGPGGAAGSSANQGSTNNVTFLTHKVTVSAESVSLPDRSVVWSESENGLLFFDPAHPDDSRFAMTTPVKVGRRVCLFEHSLTWNYVIWPPWLAMRNCIGRVNLYTIAGALPETLIFAGVEANQDLSLTEFPYWKVTYKFIERMMGFEDEGAMSGPMGWNHMLRPATGEFERVLRRNGQPVYAKVDFMDLFVQTPIP
jgi:hypothetical protein